MEEKVLIKSFSSKKTKLFFMSVTIVFLIISVIFLVLAINLGKQKWADYDASMYYYGSYKCRFCEELESDNDKIISHVLKFHNDKFPFEYVFDYGGTLVRLILHWSFLFLAGIFCLIYFLISRCNITVSDKNIRGKTFWGKEVNLPIHMVSAYSTSKIFSVIAVTTTSGFIKFPCIRNYKEIADVLQQLLNERQKRTETQESLISKQNNSKNLDDLVKLKKLLDDGIITKEEYDVKKKEVLGL